jgi:hypothetical protein
VQPENQQEVKGWGIYPGHNYGSGGNFAADKSISKLPAARKALLEDLGVNMFRVELVPVAGASYTAGNKALSTEYLDDLADHINDAKNRGVTDYLISIWSPPYHMKRVVNAGTSDAPNYRPILKTEDGGYDLFVAYVKDALVYLRNKGCPAPVALSLQNEPEAGVVSTPDDVTSSATFYDGVQLVNLIDKMRTALDAAGLSTVKLGAPESVSYEGAWIFKYSPGSSLTTARFKNTDLHIMHSYTDVSYDENSAAKVKAPLTEFLRVKKLIGKESWQTEYSVAGNAYKNTTAMLRLMAAMRVFSADMLHAGYTVWMWWCGWFPNWRESMPYYEEQVLLGGNGATEVKKSPMFDAFATIFNGAPAKSYVRKVTTNDPALKTDLRIMNDLVAFRTPKGTFVLLVNGSDKRKTYSVSGLTGATGALNSISGDDAKTVKSEDFAVSNGTAVITVPRNSVNFISTK